MFDPPSVVKKEVPMQNPLLVTFHDIDKSDSIDALIVEKFEKIKAENSNVTKCHVIVEKLSKHHQKGNMACVRMDLKIPHFEDIVTSEDCLAEAVAIKSAVTKVFKHGLDLARDRKKYRLDQKRMPTGELRAVETAETDEE